MLQSILGPHNEIEETRAGFYANCDDLLADRVTAVLDSVRAYPGVPLAPYQDSNRVERMIRDAVRALAGFSLADGVQSPSLTKASDGPVPGDS